MISKFQRFNSTLIILLVIFFSSGCVYYNTFYNARKAFNEAEKSRKKSIYKGGRINQAKYKLAIEKSLKVVEDSPNSKWYDDALYVLAVSYFYTKKYYQAERRFREIIANYGDSKYARETQIYLAKTKLELHEETDAMELFEIIFNSDYNRDFKAEAAMALGNFYYKEKNYQDAQKYFLAVRDSLGSKEEEKISQKFIADSYYNTFRFNEALGAYLQLLGMEPDKSEKYYIYYQAASCSFKLMKITDGMDYLQNLIDDEIYFDSLGVLKLLQAEGFEYDNDIEQAETVYREIAEQEDNRKVSGEANYRLGLIYQFDYDSLNEAKSFYDKTVELSRSSEYGRDAIQRSSDIGKLETFARTLLIDSSTTQDMIDEAAFAQYQLAELYWFKLNKPDTAILEMQYLIDSFPTSFDAPKAMIAISQMYREYKKDTVTADSILQKMLTEYPHSDFVPDALAALNLLETAADTGYANFYLNKAEYFLVDEENIDSARTYYQYLVDNFPDSKYYLQARFSLIWLMETYYNPGDSTVVFAYNDFIDSFPNTYWSQQAAKKVNYSPQPQMPQPEEFDSTQLADADSEIDDESIFGDDRSGMLDEDTSTFVDPLEMVYIDPNGMKIPLLDDKPIEIKEEFIYPVESYRDEWEGDLYFQILLDFSGEVIDYILKIRSGDEYIDKEAEKTVASMIFDPLILREDQQGSWLVYKFKVRKPEHLR